MRTGRECNESEQSHKRIFKSTSYAKCIVYTVQHLVEPSFECPIVHLRTGKTHSNQNEAHLIKNYTFILHISRTSKRGLFLFFRCTVLMLD